MIRHEMCLMKRDHVGGENMIKKMKKVYSLSTFVMEDEKIVAELLYHSFKYMNEKKFGKTTEPRVDQKSANKLVSQRYQNVSMKKGVNKSALYCGKVKY